MALESSESPGGWHAAADTAVATVVGALAVSICYPIYLVAAVVRFARKQQKLPSGKRGIIRL